MHMGRGSGILLLIALATACSSASGLDDACVPGLTCKTHLQLIEEPAGCSACANCPDDWGSCAPGGFACKQGQLDLSADDPSCETAHGDVSAQFVARSTGESINTLSINHYDTNAAIAVTTLAFDAASPGCLPTASTSCAYTIQALQLSLADFMIEPNDTLTWRDGTLTLTGPVAASDDADGPAVPSATAVLSFNVSSSSGQRVAVASGMVAFGVIFDYAAQAPVDLQLQGSGFDFGGYVVDDLSLSAPLTAQ